MWAYAFSAEGSQHVPDADLHFLRPWWLLFIPYVVWLHFGLRHAYSASLQWQGAIAPHLLEHLTLSGRGTRRLRPYQLMTVLLILISLVAAGPAWHREVTPFTEDRAPLVIAIELTPSMLGTDVQPNRLERARHKVRDLLEKRKGARTAVIGYAGSAHQLLPFTDDTELLEIYLEALHPNLMPRGGDAPDKALALARALLANETVPGSLLFLSDGIDRGYADRFRDFGTEGGDQLLLLAFGGEEAVPIETRGLNLSDLPKAQRTAPPIDQAGLDAVASAANGSVLLATVEDSDVDTLQGRIRTHLVNAIDKDQALSWRDEGYPLVWGVAFCMIFWFRRGWTVQWPR